MFELTAPFKPTGDQPEAIEKLTTNLNDDIKNQVLLGVTGSGKSLTYEQPVVIRNKITGEVSLVKIGEFIDRKMKHTSVFSYEDSEILSSEDMGEKYETFSWNPQNGNSEFAEITYLTRHISPSTIYNVKTKCGREVKITESHNLWILRDGELLLTKTSDLKIGDYLPLPRELNINNKPLESISTLDYVGSDVFCNLYDLLGSSDYLDYATVEATLSPEVNYRVSYEGDSVPLKSISRVINLNKLYFPLYKKNGKEFPSKVIISNAFLTLLGLFISEGHAEHEYIMVSVYETSLKRILFKSLKELSLCYSRPKDKPNDIKIYSSLLSELVTNSCGGNAYTKKLPSWFMQLSNTQLATLLSTYYSGDGWVENGRIMTCTASKELASQLLYSLLRFGIIGRVQKVNKKVAGSNKDPGTYYNVSISGQEFINRFYKQIGFVLKRKKVRLQKELGKKYNTNLDIIPFDGAKVKKIRIEKHLYQEELANKMGVSRSLISFVESNKRKFSQNTFNKMLDVLSINKDSYLKGLVNTYWSPVKEISSEKAINKYVYDFSVDRNETFLGGFGGLFVHNTYVMANVIKNIQKPTLIISHNKTLAAQLYQEFRDFFPKNAVEYFVSYYDYYQPESYIPSTDTYIEKDADINEKIDKLRLSATTSLMTRKDVIVVSSVSCIYNLGSPAEYSKVAIELRTGMKLRKSDLLIRLAQTHYERSDYDFKRGTYRVVGDVIDVFPAYVDYAVRLEILNEVLMNITHFDPLTGNTITLEHLPDVRRGGHAREYFQEEQEYLEHVMQGDSGVTVIYPAKHYITAQERQKGAIEQIKIDLDLRLKELRGMGKQIEAYRLEQRTNYDIEMMEELGYCKGIENYSRYFDGRKPGDAPYSLLEFFPKDYLLIIDESHMTVPQIRGMFNGDKARKETLINYGFRLPSAYDNRPLNFDEFLAKTNDTVFVSATPDKWEVEKSDNNVVELLIRPTGIVDPKVTILPTKGQIDDLLVRIKDKISKKQRVLVTTLTKRMAEELASFLTEKQIKVTYLHSDIATLERTTILDELRRGDYDVLVGINLLREGLDLPEVGMVAILDADKEGFLRSETSLIQTMGRASRHVQGEVIMYADNITGSMTRAINEVERRRNIQLSYNEAHGITPVQISKPIRERLIDEEIEEQLEGKKKDVYRDIDYSQLPPDELKKHIKNMEKEMLYEAEVLNFEKAAQLRDRVRELKKLIA